MTKHTCDACGKEMATYGTMDLPQVRFDIGTAEKPLPCVTGEMIHQDSGRSYWSEGRIRYQRQFNTTGISVCRDCVLSAFKKAVAELK